jgi:hypothetical protein
LRGRCSRERWPGVSCSYKLRERLEQSTGQVGNCVLILNQPATDYSQFDMLEDWVRAVKADTSSDSLAVKVLRAKPANAVDACFINGERVTDAAAA